MPRDYFAPNPEAPGKSYCDLMAVLTGWHFDPVEFGIPPVTFQATDLTHWLALDTARKALRHAGLKLEELNRARIGVVLGNSLTGEFSRSHNLRFRWPYVERSLRRALAAHGLPNSQAEPLVRAVRHHYESPLPEITEDTLAGNMSNTIAGRICNYFDFGAGGFTVDGACSSSLLSVVVACNALANGEMDFALAGGVDISLDPFEIVGFAKTRALAADDIRPYDQRAAGMLTGEGCGLVVLAREEAARAGGYPILARIRGWGFSSDGAGGLTAPGIEGQARALRRAYERAGYPPATVGLFEGHGTGTSLGDKVELTALRGVIEESPGGGVCRIGSIKANIGHCKAAAGIAGLLKAVKALERKILPPTLNCERPNLAFGSPLRSFRPCTEGMVWPSQAIPRRASVSAMGFGGANAHVALEESDPDAQPALEDLTLLGSSQASELVVLSAEDREGLRRAVERLLPLARRLCRAELTDLSAALANQAGAGSLRLAFVAGTPWDLADALQNCARKLAEGAEIAALEDPAHGVFAGIALADPQVVGLFPGQGSQRLNMGQSWLRRYPWLRAFYQEVAQPGDDRSGCRSLEEHIFKDLLSADEATGRGWDDRLRETRIAQPAIVLSSMASLRLLQFFGLHPHLAIGHSLGEISALAAAGFWDPATAVRIAALRGETMSSLALAQAGGMAALGLTPEAAQPLIGSLGSSLVISNYNSPRQTVVSGPMSAIEQLVQACKQREIPCRRLAVSHAFHSALVAPAEGAFRDRLRALNGMPQPATPIGSADPQSRARFISTVTGEPLDPESDLAEYLGAQIRQPVRFIDAVINAAAIRPALWIEIGPGAVLSGFVRAILNPTEVHCCPTDLPEEDGFDLLNRLLARAWVLGAPARLDRLFAHRFHRPFDVDRYDPQFIVNPCERPVSTGDVTEDAAPAAGAPETGRETRVVTDRGLLLAFALDWIAKRTGFPRSAVTPEKRLRDDLNLDSIKAGELTILLAQRLNRRLDTDPAALANARVSEVVEAVWTRSREHDSAVQAAVRPPQVEAPGLEDWVRLFRMEFVPAPLPDSAPVPLPSQGECRIISSPGCPQAAAIATRLSARGLQPVVTDWESWLRSAESPGNLALLVLLLPAEPKACFLECSPDEFERRVEGTAAALFRAFRWAGHGREGSELRGLVLRPATGGAADAADLDGGGGFLKSLALEYPSAQFKWLALPGSWSPERWAEVALRELQTSERAVSFIYTVEGQRLTEAALPCPPATMGVSPESARSVPLSIGAEDVVLVSGGAKGVTCELALAIARRTHARLALLGSSPLPEPGSGESELRRNLKRFAESGARALYFQADVTDLPAVRRAVLAAEAALGPITAILHGAGVTRLRRFRDKELEEFLECVRIKARGLYHLLSAVQIPRLKAVHVVSSVLGKTGMQGQADYTLANAWLDGAMRSLRAACPRLQCLSLGYTAWSGTGLAQRVGVVDSLRALGVASITVDQGVAAYLDLALRPEPEGVFVITGRLTRDLETVLYPPAPKPRGRFLEQIQHQVPGVELVADARLTHQTDLYLEEHVFEGTVVFPGVMAIEAMIQAAMACAGRSDWPVVRALEFHAPLIVPNGSPVVMRTLALARTPPAGGSCVRVVIRSSHDSFQQDHFEAECWFGDEPAPGLPAPALPTPLPAPLDLEPETLCPTPLFQGKFFRRILNIRQRDMGDASLTEILVPDGAQYFLGLAEDALVARSPAVRDSCWQSGALILPPGCLPRRLEEFRLFPAPDSPETIFCHAKVRERSATGFVVDLVACDPDGRVLEAMRGLLLEQAAVAPPKVPSPPIVLARVASDLRALLPHLPLSLVFVEHRELDRLESAAEADAEFKRMQAETPAPRRPAALGNLVAARRAALAYAHQLEGNDATIDPAAIRLAHQPNGKPQLLFANHTLAGLFHNADLSLTDIHGFSLAWFGPAPTGVDLEPVETRNAELWRGLLGHDGYRLALRLRDQTGEPFDCAATRVWTLFEAARKAGATDRLVPEFESARGGPWLGFAAGLQEVPLEFLSATLTLPPSEASPPGTSRLVALAVALRRGAARPASAPAGSTDSIESLVADLEADFGHLREACAADPAEPGLATRHAQFLSVIEAARRRLKVLERHTGPAELSLWRRQFQAALLPFLEGSENFRHTLTKPFGYAGDFRLLEMLAANRCGSRGLAYHFDQSQLEYPASVACRRRIDWISNELLARLNAGPAAGPGASALVILDLGIGAAPLEQRLLRDAPGTPFRLHAVDLETAALEHVTRRLAAPHWTVDTWRLDLREPSALAKVGELAAQSDVVVALGLLEALADPEALVLLQTLLRSLRPGAVCYTENFLPTHPTRSVMEWFLDFRLSYRSLDDLRELALEAGADPHHLELKLDPTGSLALLRMTS